MELRHILLRMALAAVVLGAAGLLAGCEEDLAPRINKFGIYPDCDVIRLHTQARLDENGNPVLDDFGEVVVDTVGTFMEVQAVARATGGNRKNDPTGANTPLDWTWDFGDGTVTTDGGVVVYHRYVTAGEYTVTLTVTDDDGDTDTRSAPVLVGAEGTTVDVLLVTGEQASDPVPRRGRIPVGSSPELRVLDLTDPADPILLGRLTLPPLTGQLEMDGNLVFAFDDAAGSGILVIDASNPAAPQRLGTALVVGDVPDFDYDGRYLYVAAGFTGLQIFDVLDPASPASVAIVGGIDYATSAIKRDQYVYLTSGRDTAARVRVADVTTPTAPALVSALSNPLFQFVGDTELVGNLLFLAGGINGLVVVDVGNPAAPTILGSAATEDLAVGLAVAGSIAYVTGPMGLQVFDVAAPATPLSLATVATGATPNDVVLVGNLAYVPGSPEGLKIFDVTDPSEPVLLSDFERLVYSATITAEGNRGYVLEFGQLLGFDVTFHGELQTPCPLTGLAEQYLWKWMWGDGEETLHQGDPTHLFPALVAPTDYQVILEVTETATQTVRSDSLQVSIPSSDGVD